MKRSALKISLTPTKTRAKNEIYTTIIIFIRFLPTMLGVFTGRFILLLILILLSKELNCARQQCVPYTGPACPSGWTAFLWPLMCLKAYEGKLRAYEAFKACKNVHGQLLTPNTDELYDASKDMMNKTLKLLFWIGLSRSPLKGASFKWIDEPKAATSLKWAVGNPKTKSFRATRQRCVALDTADLLIHDLDCQEKHYYMCFVEKQHETLKHLDWSQAHNIKYKAFFKEKNWLDAKQYCQGYSKTALLKMSTSNLRKAIKDYFAAHLRVPLKLTDEWREGQWVWERNKPARKTHWGVNKPSRSRLKNCAFMSARGDWADDPCDLASDFHICQRQMKHGPSDVEIDVKWSRSPNYVQENSTFLANCSVFYPFLGKITWVLHDKQNMTKLDDLHGNITLFQEPAYMADGTCGQKTTSTISFKVGLQHHGLRFSCFGYSDVNLPKKMCTQKGKPFKYCDISKQITVIEKPRDVKMGRILFHAPPSTLYTGQKVSFGCTAMEPRNSQLAWRVDGVSLNLEQLRGNKTSFVELTERPGKNVGETHSWISFFVREEHDGMVISCHDYSSISQPGECTHQRRRLTYCDVSPRIAVIADGPRGPPILSLDCDGYPGEIHADSKVTASCNVTHGGSGTLIWVAYFREGPKAFTYNDTDRKYLRPHTEVHKNSPANATVLLSELDFTMSLALSGLRIGCFAYDIRNYRPDTLECWDGEYCVVSKKLTAIPYKRRLWPFILILLIGPCTILMCMSLKALRNYVCGIIYPEDEP